MNVLILSSSQNEIDDYYKSIARSISKYLASNECDLVCDENNTSVMQICYDEFRKCDRHIYTFPTNESDFKLVYENSDLIICLPGGVGTISKLLTYLEERRKNDKHVPFIVYNEDGYYTKLVNVLNDVTDNNFVAGINEIFALATNRSEFEDVFYNVYYEMIRRKK